MKTVAALLAVVVVGGISLVRTLAHAGAAAQRQMDNGDYAEAAAGFATQCDKARPGFGQANFKKRNRHSREWQPPRQNSIAATV